MPARVLCMANQLSHNVGTAEMAFPSCTGAMVTAAAVGLAMLMALPATAQPAIYTANDGSITLRVNGQTGVCVCVVHLVPFRT